MCRLGSFDAQRHLVGDADAVAFQSDHLLRVIRQHAYISKAEVDKNLRADAALVLHHALTGVQAAMRSYAPDGSWGEGPAYWAYATSYNVTMLACLESALGSSFGLDRFPGFSETGLFPLYTTLGGKRAFNYADCRETVEPSDCLLWLGRRFRKPGACAPRRRRPP